MYLILLSALTLIHSFVSCSGYPALQDNLVSVNCTLDQGAKLSIVATVLYFCCIVMTPRIAAPTPIGLSSEESNSRAAHSGGGAAKQSPSADYHDQTQAEATEEEP